VARGGYRKPSKPAPVSGPGRLSKRTDGQPVRNPGGMAYGENADFTDIQSSAPMAATRTPQTQGQRAAYQPGAAPPTPLSAPTERPDEPVTEGSPVGPGSGPSVLSTPPPNQQRDQDLAAFKSYLPMLEQAANMGGVSPRFVQFVRKVRNA
jgi:hypothetical protein